MNLRIKDYTTKVGSGVTPKGGAESYLSSGIPLFRSQNVHNFGFLLDDIAYISEEIDEQMSGSRVLPGDVLLNITGASIGRCFFTSDDFERGNVNQHVCIIRPNQRVVKSSFLHYLLISNKGQMYIDLSQTGANRQGLTIEEIRNFSFDIPSLVEQQRIVDYLDKKLATIDHRVEVLEKEKDAYARLKKIVINQTVTRGLNPNAALKDSGIDWIGMIPEHWNVRRIKEIADLNSGTTPSTKNDNYYNRGIHPWINTGCVQDCEIYEPADYVTDLAMKECKGLKYIPEDSILLAMYGGGTIGNVGILKFSATINQACCAITLDKKIADVRYIFYYLLSIKKWMISRGFGGTQINLSQGQISNFCVSLPPLSEQQAIANYLDEKCAKIDAAIENISKQIDASKRLKKAIINEAISGKEKI